jgi:hypothetical protein
MPPEPTQGSITPERLKAAGGVAGAVAAAGVLLRTLANMSEDATKVHSWFATTPNLVIFAVVVVALLWFLYVLVTALRARTREAEAERFVTSLTNGAILIGREDDIQALEHLITECREVHLLGQEGIGKTALLQNLVAKLMQQPVLRPIIISSWSGGIASGPMTKLGEQVWQSLTPEHRQRLSVPASIRTDQLEAVIRAFREVTGLKPLIVLDQVEEYQVLHCDFLFDAQGHDISRDKLVAGNEFWSLLELLLNENVVHLLVAHSPGTRVPALIEDTSEFALPRVQTRAVETFLLTAVASEIRSKYRWTDLCKQLMKDLSMNEGVMPRQLVFACGEIALLPRLTVAAYEDAGRLPGLAIHFVHRQVFETAYKLGFDADLLSGAVRTLVANDQPAHRTTAEIRRLIRSTDGDGLEMALADLERSRVLRRRVNPEKHLVTWSPIDSIITAGIGRLGEATDRWTRLLNSYSVRHGAAKWNPWRWWRTLLPASVQVGLLLQRLRGNIRYGQSRAFATVSALRMLPYIVPLVALTYLVGAELSWPVPFGEFSRDFLYIHHIELTKHVVVEREVEQRAAEARLRIVGMILRRTRDPWIQPGEPTQTIQHENWIQAQALAALFRTPELPVAQRRRMRESLDALFAPTRTIKDARGRPYGWLPNESAAHTSAEPVLWAVSALAGVFPNLTDAEQPAQLSKMMFAHAAAELYGPSLPSFDGGWNMFPNQVDVQRHSTYSSALALSALLDTRAAQLLWYGTSRPSEERRDQLIQRTAGWLVRTYDSKAREWYPTPADRKPQDGLTFQVFAVLLRASNEAGVDLPKNLVADIPRRLSVLMRAHVRSYRGGAFTKYPYWNNLMLTNHRGEVVPSEAPPFKYAWYPWAIDCATQWLSYVGNHDGVASVEALASVQRVRDRLVITQMDDAVVLYTGPAVFTFVGAELLYCLDSIPPPHHEREDRP